MAKIFISYRRDDTQYQADRLYELIKPMVPDPDKDIFIDVDNIPLGVDFVDHLGERVGQCGVLLALIGSRWLDTQNPKTQERRLDDQDDFVRIEIAQALKRNIRVIPIMFDGAQLPDETELPDELKPLVRRNGIPISRSSFEHDVKRLLKGLGLVDPSVETSHQNADIGEQTSSFSNESSRLKASSKPRRNNVIMPLISMMLLAALGLGVWLVDPFLWFDQSRLPAPVIEASGLKNDLSKIDFNAANINTRQHFERLNVTYSVESLQRVAQQGNAAATILLGTAYEVGLNVEQDYTKARTYYENACTSNEARGCVFLGFLYDRAMGVSQNNSVAREYYSQSCEGGSPLGCNNLGYFTENGLGGIQDKVRARELYISSCDRGENLGCNNLAAMDQPNN